MGKTLWLGKLSVSAGVTGRGNNDSNPPWMGFYYGSWLPHMHWNGGRFGRREVVDVGWYWLCFHGSLTWWPGGGNWFWNIRPKTPNVEFSGPPAASSPEAPLERRVGLRCQICDDKGAFWDHGSCGGHASQLTVCRCDAGRALVDEAKRHLAKKRDGQKVGADKTALERPNK